MPSKYHENKSARERRAKSDEERRLRWRKYHRHHSLADPNYRREQIKTANAQRREWEREQRVTAQHDATMATMAREQAELEAEAKHRGVDISVIIQERMS
jgi:hypothetical protein